MSIVRIKKVLLASTALAAVVSFSTQAMAATDTLTANGTWGYNANGLPAVGTGAGDNVNLATFALTVTNDQVANDGSANKDTFSLGTIDNSVAGTGAIDITQAAAGTTNPLSVTIGSVTNSGTGASTMTITNNNTANKAVNVTDSGALTLGGALAIDNVGTTSTAATNLTVTGAAAVTGTTAITAGTAAGSDAILTLNNASNTLTGLVTLTDVAGGAGGQAKLIFGTANTTDTLTGGVNANAADEGTVLLNGSNVITGAIGTINAVHEVDAGAAGTTSSISGATKATTVKLTGTGAFTNTGAVTATNLDVNGTGSVTLNAAANNAITNTVFNADGTVNVGTGGTLTSAVTTATTNTGTLAFTGAGTMTGAVGTASKQLKLINAGAGAVSISGLANATALDFNGTNTVSLNGAGANTIGTVAFGANDGTLSLGAGANLTGAITTATVDQGTVTLAGASTVSGSIGTATDEVKMVNSGTENTASTFSGAVYAKGINVVGTTDAANAGSTAFGSTLSVGSDGMTVASHGLTTAQTESATVAGTFTDAGVLNITAAATAGATATLTLDGATNTVTGVTTLTDGAGAGALATLDVKGATDTFTGGITGSGAGKGTLTLDGTGTQTITGAIGATSLATVNASSTVATKFVNAVTATTINVTGADAATFESTANGAVVFGTGATGSATFDGALTGSVNGTGGVAGSGVGTVTLDATSAGVTTIGNTGILKALTLNNPTAGTAITVTTSGNVAAADTTNLGINTLTDGGTFALGAGQALNLTSYSSTVYGNVAATGAATTNATSTINFTNNVSGNATYNLITSGAASTYGGTLKVNGATVTTTASTAGLMKYQEVLAGNNLEVTATRQAITSALGSALTSNDLSVGSVLDAIKGTATGNLATAENLLASGSTATALHNSLQSMTPTVDGGAEQAALAVGDQTGGIINTRLAALRNGDTTSGVAAGYSTQGLNTWFEGYGQHAHQDMRSSVNGYTSNTAGGAVGIDTSNLPNGSVFGFAINYGHSWVDSQNANTTSTNLDNYGGNFYGTYKMPENTFINGQLGYAYNSIESDRHNADLAGDTAVGNTHSDQYTARAALGRDYAARGGMMLTPLASINYTYLKTAGYTETGAGASDLTVKGNDQNILDLGLGVNARWKIKADDQGDIVTPGLHAGYTYSAIDDKVQTSSSFTGDPANTIFTTTGASPARSTFDVGANVVYATVSNWDFSANYDFQYKSDYTSHTGELRATVHF